MEMLKKLNYYEHADFDTLGDFEEFIRCSLFLIVASIGAEFACWVVLNENSFKITVFTVAFITGYVSRRYSLTRFEVMIEGFDPTATHYMVNNGFDNFLNWFDERAWYPLGRTVGGTVYPGLMITSGMTHHVLNLLNISVYIRDVCFFIGPVISVLTAISMYFLTNEIWNEDAGPFAAFLIALAPGYINRSVAGSYNNEEIAIFALILTYYFWIKAVKTGAVFWAVLSSLAYFCMVSAWGGYVFITYLIPLHVFTLLLMGRYSNNLYVAYSRFYILGLLLSMQFPFVGFQPVRTSEHMASAGVFILLNAYGFLKYLQSFMSNSEIKMIFISGVIGIGRLVCFAVVVLTYTGYIAPGSVSFYSLWNTGYAKIHIPIIASVTEHQPITWYSYFFDFKIDFGGIVIVFPVGFWHCIQNINDERVFIVLYAITGVYFAGVMGPLMLTLTPAVCVLSGIAFLQVLMYFQDAVFPETSDPPLVSYFSLTKMREILNESISKVTESISKETDSVSKESDSTDKKGNKNWYHKAGKITKGFRKQNKRKIRNETGLANIRSCLSDLGANIHRCLSYLGANIRRCLSYLDANIRSIVISVMIMILMMFAVHCTWVTGNAYSSPSIVLSSYSSDGSRLILDDFREAYSWLAQNTSEDSHVMSWWDYGQLQGMGNPTTLVDNNTCNNSHSTLVGKAMASNESAAYEIMKSLDVDYVLVIFGGVVGYSEDDINKFLWMVRYAEGEHTRDIKESDYCTSRGEFSVDEHGSPTLLNCLMYKLSYYRFGELQMDFYTPSGYDRTRNMEIGDKNFKPEHLEEAHTTKNLLVRIYRVKKDNRPRIPYNQRKIKINHRFISKKTSKRRKGTIKNRPVVKKGKRISRVLKKFKN